MHFTEEDKSTCLNLKNLFETKLQHKIRKPTYSNYVREMKRIVFKLKYYSC